MEKKAKMKRRMVSPIGVVIVVQTRQSISTIIHKVKKEIPRAESMVVSIA